MCGGSQLTTNNKVVQNNQSGQAFESLKAMRTTTVKDANALLSDVKGAKKRIFDVSKAIEQKQKTFAEQAKTVVKEEKVAEQPKVKEVKPTVEENKTVQPVVEKTEAKQDNTVVEKKGSVNIEISYVKPLIDQQPKDQKIFIDDKGNKIVIY